MPCKLRAIGQMAYKVILQDKDCLSLGNRRFGESIEIR